MRIMTPVLRRHGALWFGALLAMPVPFAAALARPEDSKPGASLAGQLLVATPEMGDPRFRQTVILMVQHDGKGALGIAINRPLNTLPVARLLDALGIDSKDSEGEVQVFAGGPVEPQVGFVVHSADYHRSGTVDIDGRVAMTADPAVLRDIGHHAGPRRSLVAFGYAGWGAGQLDGELMLGGWFTVPEEPRLVFDFDRDKLWDEVMKRRTVPL
jgi:putative transcriptional regulator